MSGEKATAYHSVVAVDPGKDHAGVAELADGVVIRCALIRAEGPYRVAVGVAAWTGRMLVDDLVVEGQQIYPRSKGDPNDMLPLAQVVGGVLARVTHIDHHNPLPREWKGSTPKDVFTARIEAGLTEAERDLVDRLKLPKSLRHNVLDAIGLGKWCYERVSRQTVR